MPTRPRKPCATPGCPALVRRGHCAKHRRRADRRLRERQPWRRGRYGAAWAKRAARYLARHRTCECQADCPWHEGRPCDRPSAEADHRIPVRRGGTDDDDNLQALCKSCHSRKTITESPPT